MSIILSTRIFGSRTRILGLCGACVGLVSASTLADPDALMSRPREDTRGHPAFTAPPFPGAVSPLRAQTDRGGGGSTPLPTASPIESGTFVNFESPSVKALAVSADARTLFLANTPAGMLTVLDAVAPTMRVIRNIPVGADPVTAAIQPGTGDRIVWTANFISDDVSVVEVTTGRVLRVIDVGDEPVNILFSRDGAFAYVVLQGPHALAQPPFNQFSSLVTIDTQSLTITSVLALPGNNARGAAYDAQNKRIFIAALHSGNNTTVVGNPITRFFPPPVPGGNAPSDSLPSLQIVKLFSATAGLFNSSPSLAPYPDVSVQPNPPLVQRIVKDAGEDSEWASVVDILADDSGQPDPAMVALYASEFGVTNAFDILTRVIRDAKDTRDIDVIVLDAGNPAEPSISGLVPQGWGNVGTTLTALAFDPTESRLIVTNIDAKNTIRHEPALRGKFVTHEVVITGPIPSETPVTPTLLRADLHAGLPQAIDAFPADPQIVTASLANPIDVVVSPSGARAYVAANGPGRVGVIDMSNGRVLSRVNVGRGVRSLALDASGRRLFAYNRTDSSVSRVDLSGPTPVVTATARVFNPEPKPIRAGRNFAYSSNFGAGNLFSCTTCHIDINLDHLAWDLGNPGGAMLPTPTIVGGENHPLKGPMVTQSLRGLKGHNAFHWRGDKPEFVDFNAAFDGLLGGNQLSTADMQKFDAFIKTVVYPPNPFWTRQHAPKDPAVIPGISLFAANCGNCHTVNHDGTLRLPGFPDDAGMELGFMFSQVQEIAQLRALYKKFPADTYSGAGLLHDGRVESESNGHPLITFLRTFFRHLNAQERSDLTAMVTAFPTNATNVLGWQVRLDSPAGAQQLSDINTMIGQNHAAPSRCDVIAQGLLSGQPRGFLYEPSLDSGPGAPIFRSDRNELIALAQLASVQPGDTLVFMAAPPGSGRRWSIDYDSDCKLNGLDPFPYSSPDVDENGSVTVQDLFDFLAQWFAGAPEGDFNWTGDVSVQDIFDFLAAWFAGGCA